jgi:hypothetical protein
MFPFLFPGNFELVNGEHKLYFIINNWLTRYISTHQEKKGERQEREEELWMIQHFIDVTSYHNTNLPAVHWCHISVRLWKNLELKSRK